MTVVALSTAVEGSLVVVAAFILFGGSVWLLLAAIFGVRMGYLITATALFGFMILLSALWAFGAPIPGGQIPAFLGPKGELPSWKPVGVGVELESSTYPAIGQYPQDPWVSPMGDEELEAEEEPATTAFREFLAEEANAELKAQGVEGEVPSDSFQLEDLRFTTVDGTDLAAARAFSVTGGPVVEVLAFRDLGNEPLPSYLFLAGSVLGFVIHLPFLDRAERKRKEILTGGEQPPFRGPA